MRVAKVRSVKPITEQERLLNVSYYLEVLLGNIEANKKAAFGFKAQIANSNEARDFKVGNIRVRKSVGRQKIDYAKFIKDNNMEIPDQYITRGNPYNIFKIERNPNEHKKDK